MIRLLFAGAALAVCASAQATLVVPAAVAAVDGNSSTSYPFDIAAGRLLYVYDSSHFTGNGVNFPILISGIRYRANGTTTTWAGSTAQLQMDLSTAAVDYNSISTTWNANHGTDRATVYNGAWNIPAGSSTAGVPGPFYATVTFVQPFLYDPSLGDLVIDTTSSGITTANTPTLDCVTTAGVAAAKRVYSVANPPAATATLWSGELANVLEFTYVPASGLYAGFNADVTGGFSPLTVNFVDQSYSSDPGGVLAWAWDLDGDSVIDSTAQNPTWVYTNCGTYDVTLTVIDGSHGPATLTRTAFIATDRIQADFTHQVIGPQTVMFTDTSNVPATTWAWDLDGDNVVDSTAQSAAWVYPNQNPVNVTLTVTRLCSPPSTITRTVVPAQQLSTNLASNNSVGSPATIYFDLNVTNPTGINIGSFDSVSTNLSTPFTVDWYVKSGTYSGFELNPAPWHWVAQASGTSNAVSLAPSNAAFAQALYLPPGNYGIAMRYVGITPRYVSLTTPTPYGNPDLTMTLGSASLSTGGPFTGTNLNTPRGWSGTLYYDTHNVSNRGGYGFFAPGCPGTLGLTSLTGNLPQLGTTFALNLNNLPNSVAILMTGFSRANSPFGPLPVDLTAYGAPGCFGRVAPDITSVVIGANNAGSWSFAIPNSPAISGLPLYQQALVIDAAANALGAVVSHAAAMLIGQ